MDEYRKSNLDLWNNWTDIHAKSAMYDVEGFKAGKLGLHPLEREELANVSGKTLLHMQCHFGKDTLSWARLGAQVTGADFSDKAITLARSLSQELNIPATFICTDIYELPNVLSGEFDIVFTSYGAIGWLPDIYRWAQVAAHFVKPGGTFYIAEYHPFAYVFDNPEKGSEDQGLRLAYAYSTPRDEPLRFETQGSYADPEAEYRGVEYGWNHSLGDIVTALASAGLRIEFLHEFHYSTNPNMFVNMEEREDGYSYLKDPQERASIPLMFSIKATKDVGA